MVVAEISLFAILGDEFTHSLPSSRRLDPFSNKLIIFLHSMYVVCDSVCSLPVRWGLSIAFCIPQVVFYAFMGEYLRHS